MNQIEQLRQAESKLDKTEKEKNEKKKAYLAAGQSPQTVSTTTEGWAFENQPSTQLCPPEAIMSNDTSSAQLNIAFHQL